MNDKGNRMTCADGGCPISSGLKALKRFFVKHIPLFRRRAEKTAVNALLDKMRDSVEEKQDVAVEESAKHLRK